MHHNIIPCLPRQPQILLESHANGVVKFSLLQDVPGCDIKHLRRDEAHIANDVGVDLMPVVEPLFVRRKPGRRDRENFSIAVRRHALWVFWRQLDIVLEHQELAMFGALHMEGCQQAAAVDDDVAGGTLRSA